MPLMHDIEYPKLAQYSIHSENTPWLTFENVYLKALAFLPKISLSSAGAMCSAISTFTIQNRM
jgi:hypothetical protein